MKLINQSIIIYWDNFSFDISLLSNNFLLLFWVLDENRENTQMTRCFCKNLFHDNLQKQLQFLIKNNIKYYLIMLQQKHI